MRRITNHLNAGGPENERGASAVITAIMMTLLLAFAAISVDVGLLYASRAQLQNGADAAALAIANNCAKGSCVQADNELLAAELAKVNSNDAQAKFKSVTRPTATSVSVVVSKDEATGNPVQLVFANIFGHSQANVGATATASWGAYMGSAAAFPLVFSNCQFDLGGAPHLMQSHKLKDGNECDRGQSGLIIPGNFGWLIQDAGKCQASLDLDAGGYTNKLDTGNNPPSNCDTLLNSWAATINSGGKAIVLLPVYDEAVKKNDGKKDDYDKYHIRGFAAIQVLGWKFSGGDDSPPMSFHNTKSLAPSGMDCTGDCRGIIGKFIKHVSLEEGSIPGGTDLGLTSVRLTK